MGLVIEPLDGSNDTLLFVRVLFLIPALRWPRDCLFVGGNDALLFVRVLFLIPALRWARDCLFVGGNDTLLFLRVLFLIPARLEDNLHFI